MLNNRFYTVQPATFSNPDRVQIQVQADGNTVWLHRNGETIARFGRMGIDIHRSIQEQMDGQSQCLDCRHTIATTLEDWQQFVSLIEQHFGVVIPTEAMPDRLAEKNSVEPVDTIHRQAI